MGSIIWVSGNIFDTDADTLVNPVNCVGVMGRGLAREFRIRFPDMYFDYVNRCRRNEVVTGMPYIYYGMPGKPNIVNFPTKLHWRDPSRIEWIEYGLRHILANYKRWGIGSIAFPALGCGNGGLQWHHVRPIMMQYLCEMSIPVYVFEPH